MTQYEKYEELRNNDAVIRCCNHAAMVDFLSYCEAQDDFTYDETIRDTVMYHDLFKIHKENTAFLAMYSSDKGKKVLELVNAKEEEENDCKIYNWF